MNQIVSLEGKRIIVTGAGQGLGRAASELLASLGAKVAVVDLKPEGIEEFARARCDNALSFTGSVSDPELAPMVVAKAIEAWGGVDGLVNNAGISRAAMIEKMTFEQWKEVIDVHLTGSFLFLQAV